MDVPRGSREPEPSRGRREPSPVVEEEQQQPARKKGKERLADVPRGSRDPEPSRGRREPSPPAEEDRRKKKGKERRGDAPMDVDVDAEDDTVEVPGRQARSGRRTAVHRDHPYGLDENHVIHLRPNESIYSTVVDVWIEHVIRASIPEVRVTPVFSIENLRSNVLANRLRAHLGRRNPDFDVIMPVLYDAHYLLVIIIPMLSRVYVADSLDDKNISLPKEFIREVENHMSKPNIKWINIKSPQQVSGIREGRNNCGIHVLMNIQWILPNMVTLLVPDTNLQRTDLQLHSAPDEMKARRALMRDCLARLLKPGITKAECRRFLDETESHMLTSVEANDETVADMMVTLMTRADVAREDEASVRAIASVLSSVRDNREVLIVGDGDMIHVFLQTLQRVVGPTVLDNVRLHLCGPRIQINLQDLRSVHTIIHRHKNVGGLLKPAIDATRSRRAQPMA